ncbi:O-acetyl-ADP-ribose deacetylase [Pseudenhygromyxa sp. WMMC2535]|uniref:O-acetyl-ADP-ribose deacetylase n=1 Tax=Pseudenhygromyxa sp. WMMC2535 TaxID=2712867 RepID=UPI001557DDA9|nr:O-acetyl-ADP-ribose deacetylase [Pseudenhygromyxa sp. WMMC2535]NVB42876.1 O-acetyl-ADP-ribose deacetylase [Pseudenhygromyxa sp. WMMC2535]
MPVEISITRGDITTLECDAIVNAANPKLLGGGGVDGAIHRAAGPKLLEACRALPRTHGIRCPFGEARITPGFDLPAAWVIHTVGPIYHRTPEPDRVLRAAHRNCLGIAAQRGLRSLAFPAISTGAYGFPVDRAAQIALSVVRESQPGWGSVVKVHFVLFTNEALEAYQRAFADPAA